MPISPKRRRTSTSSWVPGASTSAGAKKAPPKKLNKIKRGGVSYSGIPAGAIKKGKRLQKGFNKGVKLTTEIGGLLNTKIGAEAGPTVIVGHGTCPAEQTLTLIWRSIVRVLAEKVGVRVTDLDKNGFGEDAQVNLRYMPNQQFGTARTSIAFVITPAMTLNTLAVNMMTFWMTLGEQAVAEDIEFVPIQIDSASKLRYVNMPLVKSRVQFYCKSSLKMQNRTVEAVADNEADDVNNAPLFGKTYEGRGNGMRSIDNGQQISFVADDNFGHIYKSDTRVSSQAFSLREPPNANQFQNVSKSGKAQISPGEVKTSYLVHKGSASLASLLQLFNQESTPAGQNQIYKKFGKFRVMILEKMLQVGTLADDLGIKLGYEVNNYYQFTFIPKYESASVHQVRVGNVETNVQ